MRIQDIIRSMVDMIDHVQSNKSPATPTIVVAHQVSSPEHDAPGELSPLSNAGGSNDDEELARMKQIAGLLPVATNAEYANEPQEMYADIDAVTKDAGGGWMAPKHPSDIRVQHPSAYPGHQHKVGE